MDLPDASLRTLANRAICSTCLAFARWTAHPVIVAIRDNKDWIEVLLYSYCTTITGWGVLPRHSERCKQQSMPHEPQTYTPNRAGLLETSLEAMP